MLCCRLFHVKPHVTLPTSVAASIFLATDNSVVSHGVEGLILCLAYYVSGRHFLQKRHVWSAKC